MRKLENGYYIIGFDDGYQFGKTARFVFDNGVYAQGSVDAALEDHTLFYDGEYYKIGEGRSVITPDKVSDETARLRTMVAIAMEFRESGIRSGKIILAVGVPFMDYGRQKQKTIDYYNRKKQLHFCYEGQDYSVEISSVIVCPQCYSAVAQRLANMKKDCLIVDIGSKTTDIVYVKDRHPLESKSGTLEIGMVKWMQLIMRDFKAKTGKDIPEDEIMKIILHKENNLLDTYINLIKEMLAEKVRVFELELNEKGYSIEYLDIIYVGGGATVVQEYTRENRRNISYDCNLSVNAEGYEFLAEQIMRREIRNV